MASVVPHDTSQNFNENVLKSNNEEGFVRVESILKLEPILKSRLPSSAHVLNAMKISTKWGSDYRFYAHGLENPSTAWIVVKFQCSDFESEIMISRPQEQPIPSQMREFFKRAPFINWDKAFLFVAVDQCVSSLVTDISIRDYGNGMHVHPCHMFYLEIEDAIKLKSNDSARIITLSSDQGKEFIQKTWKYASEKSSSYLEKMLKCNPSSGVLADGKIVSGASLATTGLISMLCTLKEARGKGYAMATMHSLMKDAAYQCVIPACTVEIRNLSSKLLQKKLGFKEGPIVDYLYYGNEGFD